MKANELMVGNWVNYKSPSSGKLRPIKIANIYGCEFNCEVENWNIISGKSISDTEPIPLTEEILAKNGFVKDGNGDYEINDGIVIVMDWKGKSEHFACAPYEVENCFGQYHYLYVELFECKYVHQLQNLLVIAGVEKEIEL